MLPGGAGTTFFCREVWNFSTLPHIRSTQFHTRLVYRLFILLSDNKNVICLYSRLARRLHFHWTKNGIIECKTKKCGIMKKLMLSVAVFMMSVSVSSFVSYAQSPSEEPAPTDSVPAQEPKSEALLFSLKEEPAPADSVPSQEPKSEFALFCLSEEPAPSDTLPSQEPKKDEPGPSDTLPSQEPQKDEPQGEASLLCMTEEPAPTDTVPTQEPTKDEPQVDNLVA